MGVTKDFLTQLVQDNIYPNNSRLVSALALQEVLVEMIGSFSLEQSFEMGEVATGAKWVDGKDIYRQVINLDSYFRFANSHYPIGVQDYLGSYYHVDHIQVMKADGSFCDLSTGLISVELVSSSRGGLAMRIGQAKPGPAFVSGYAVVSYTKGEAPSYL